MASITKNGITLSQSSGSGNASITITATENTTAKPRLAIFKINSEVGTINIRVTQAPATT